MAKITDAFKELEDEQVYALVDEALANGTDPLAIVDECNAGLVEVGNLFNAGEYYLTELMFSAEIMETVMAKIGPHMPASAGGKKGTVIIGTVKDDVHDVGKNIVISLLKSYGYDVIDMGVDVPTEKFVEAVKAHPEVKVLGLSALLNTTYPQMKTVIDALAAEGLRDKVKVIIGGTICSEEVRKFTGADDFAVTAMKTIDFCNEIYGA